MPDHDVRRNRSARLRAIVDQFEGPLVRFATRLLGDAHRAQDVVQDVFLKLCREQPASFVDDPDGGLRAWLYTVCRHRSLDVLKKESRMNSLTNGQTCAHDDGQMSHAERLERLESAGRAAVFLDRLPANQRDVIRLKVQDGLSYREISQITGLSVSNVGYLLHVGLLAIRKQMLADGAT